MFLQRFDAPNQTKLSRFILLAKSENIGALTMEARYDSEVDVLRINWSKAEVEESDSVSPGVIVDYDADGNAIGIEILNASQKIDNFQPVLSGKKAKLT